MIDFLLGCIVTLIFLKTPFLRDAAKAGWEGTKAQWPGFARMTDWVRKKLGG